MSRNWKIRGALVLVAGIAACAITARSFAAEGAMTVKAGDTVVGDLR